MNVSPDQFRSLSRRFSKYGRQIPGPSSQIKFTVNSSGVLPTGGPEGMAHVCHVRANAVIPRSPDTDSLASA